MASGYRNDVSQYVREEIRTVTKEFQERVTFDDRDSTYPSYSSEYKYTENTTWASYDHEKNHMLEYKSNDVQTTHNNDTNISYESHHGDLVSSFDGTNLSVDSYQETSNNTSSSFQYESLMYKDSVNDSEYGPNDHTYPEIREEAENSENSEDHISLHDDYEYSGNSEDYYSEDNYEYSVDSEDYYYDDDDD